MSVLGSRRSAEQGSVRRRVREQRVVLLPIPHDDPAVRDRERHGWLEAPRGVGSCSERCRRIRRARELHRTAHPWRSATTRDLRSKHSVLATVIATATATPCRPMLGPRRPDKQGDAGDRQDDDRRDREPPA